MNTKETLTLWQDATEQLKEAFIKKYFGKDAEYYWIADCIGEVLYVNDRFFGLTDIVDFIQYRYTADQMFSYIDYRLDLQEKGESPINIKNWKLKK